VKIQRFPMVNAYRSYRSGDPAQFCQADAQIKKGGRAEAEPPSPVGRPTVSA
jgi:hypothetical protein